MWCLTGEVSFFKRDNSGLVATLKCRPLLKHTLEYQLKNVNPMTTEDIDEDLYDYAVMLTQMGSRLKQTEADKQAHEERARAKYDQLVKVFGSWKGLYKAMAEDGIF